MTITAILITVWLIPIVIFSWWWFKDSSGPGSLADVIYFFVIAIWTVIMGAVALGVWIGT